MAFFSFNPTATTTTDASATESFRVSELWWLYFAVTVPLTLGVFAVWDAWRRRRLRGKAGRRRSDGEWGGRGSSCGSDGLSDGSTLELRELRPSSAGANRRF